MGKTQNVLSFHAELKAKLLREADDIFNQIKSMELEDQVETVNELRKLLHAVSPFKDEPVDCVLWEPAEDVQANDYNPNSVAPPEMELLRVSIMSDGYTQPIVANREDERYVVIDGFHRNRVGKECKDVNARVRGYLPIVQIKTSQTDLSDRMAATIRHNRARGKHRVDAMSEIVLELKRRNWSDDKIGRELGMDPDEVLRLTQISGLAEMFSDQEFSEAWDPGVIDEVELMEEKFEENDD
jgi:ParB-like chromosome segregation protein Spo0J